MLIKERSGLETARARITLSLSLSLSSSLLSYSYCYFYHEVDNYYRIKGDGADSFAFATWRSRGHPRPARPSAYGDVAQPKRRDRPDTSISAAILGNNRSAFRPCQPCLFLSFFLFSFLIRPRVHNSRSLPPAISIYSGEMPLFFFMEIKASSIRFW